MTKKQELLRHYAEGYKQGRFDAAADAALAEPSDEGRFPDEAESEYRKNFEAKCKKTGINLLAEPSDADVQIAAMELREFIEYAEKYGVSAYNANYYVDYLEQSALRQYQKPTDEAVRDCSTCIGCECEPPLGETVQDCKAYVKREPTDEAVQRAILWIESGKADGMRDWDNADQEWKSEPGAKEMHEDFLSAFDLAIQGLRQMRTEPDCSTAEWQGGYCLGYGKSDTDDEPCEVCKACPKQASYEEG